MGAFVPQDIKNCSSYGYLKYFWKTLVSCCLAALLILAFNLFEVYTIIRFYFCRQFSLSFLCGKWYSFDVNILNTKRKLNVHRTLRRRLGRLLYIQFISCVQGKYDLVTMSLHKKWSFPLRISPVNVTKSGIFREFGDIYWRNS